MRNFWLNTTKHYGKVRLLEPSREAKHRQRIIEWYEGHGQNAALTCRHFGISRDRFYRWFNRFQASGLGGLEDGSHRPKRVRKPTWSRELEQAVLELRRLTPGWGKDKLVVLLRKQGWQCSTSMVGRILKRLKDSGQLVEAPGADPWHPRRPFLRPYGVRKPKEYLADRPGLHLVHRLIDAAPGPGTRIVVYGHSHKALVAEREGVLWVNPGAAGRVGFHHEVTLALLRVGDDRCEAELVLLGPRMPAARRSATSSGGA